MGEIATGALRAIGEGAIGLAVKGFGALSGAITDGIADARANAQIQAQTAAVITSTGAAAGVSAQHVADYASSLSDAAGTSLFGDDQIQQSTNLLLTFTEIKGATLDAATAISVDMAQAMGGAPKDAAIQLGKALNDPIKGISALSRVGVSFSEEQKAMITAMQEAGDTAGAQAIILAELNKEFGGSAQAAADATGGWSEFNGRLGEAKEAIGTAILPILNQLAGVLVEQVMPVVEQAAAAFSAWVSDPAVQQGIQQIADAIMTGLAVAFTFLTDTAIPALLAGWALIQPAIAAILPLFQGDMPAGLNTAGAAFTQLQATIGAVMAGVQAVVNAVLPQITAFWQAHGAEIMAFATETWNRIMEIVRTALALIAAIVGPALQAIAGFISAHGAEIQALLSNTWNAIKAAIDIVLTLIQGVIKAAMQMIQGDWSGAWETIKQMCARVVENLITIIESGVGNIVTLFGGLASQVMDALQGLVNDAATIGGNIIQGIIDGVSGGVGALVNAVEGAAQAALDAALSLLDIGSPSRVFEQEVGEPIIQGMIEGVQAMIPGLMAVMSGVANLIISQAEELTVEVQERANKMQETMLKQAESISDKLSNTMADAFMGTASLDRAKAKAISAMKDISAAQQEEVQRNVAEAARVAGGFGDPKQQAAFFKMRTDQIMELAKLRDQIEKASDETSKARLIEQYNLIGKAQQAELQAFDAKGNNSPLLDITSKIQALLTDPNRPNDETGVIAQLFAALPGLVAMTGNAGVSASNSTNNSSFTYAPTVNTTSNIPPWLDWTTAKALSGI
jgi:phage-related protein